MSAVRRPAGGKWGTAKFNTEEIVAPGVELIFAGVRRHEESAEDMELATHPACGAHSLPVINVIPIPVQEQGQGHYGGKLSSTDRQKPG